MIICKEIHDWKEEVGLNVCCIEHWATEITSKNEKEAAIPAWECEICGSRDGLELHHIAGRKHDYRTITVCRACHRELSDEQKTWDKRWEGGDRPEAIQQAFFLLGFRDILRLKARKTGDSNYELLANMYREEISRLLRGDADDLLPGY